MGTNIRVRQGLYLSETNIYKSATLLIYLMLKTSSGFWRKWCDLISGINAETVGSATNTLMEQAWAELCQAQAQLC